MLSAKPYVYQDLHIVRGEIKHLEAHIVALRCDFERCFGRKKCVLNIREISAEVMVRAASVKSADHFSVLMQIGVTCDGEVVYSDAQKSMYLGYALRALTPDAVMVDYQYPMDCWHSSAVRSIEELLEVSNLSDDARSVVRCQDGVVMSCYAKPLFTIRGKVVSCSLAHMSVEFELVRRACEMADLKFEVEPILQSEVDRYDEVFVMTSMGITSFAHVDRSPFMTLKVLRLVEPLNKLNISKLE